MDRAFDPPALVLLDEVGSGTDPAEGGALGTGDPRSLPPARRDGRRDDPRRCAEVVRGDDGGRGHGGIRIRS